MDDQRQLVASLLANESSRKKFESAAGKLGTIRAVLAANVFRSDQTYELQCLGVVLGDALVMETELQWTAVEDEYGRNPVVCVPGTTILAFPLTMISKRVERGEDVDVFELFEMTLAETERMNEEGYS